MSGTEARCPQPELTADSGKYEAVWAGCTVKHFTYDWQMREESSHQRRALLEGIRRDIAKRALAHLLSGQDSVLLLATPPGTGKSTAVAALGDPEQPNSLNLAWIAERHEMAEQVPALARYNHIQRCTHENCPEGYRLHEALLERGLPTFWLHQQHAEPCDYVQQFHQQTSAFYQLAHVRTAHPAKHPDGIVIDELNLEAWLEPYEVTRARILEARAAYARESQSQSQSQNLGWRLLIATLEVMHQATLMQQECAGQTLFAALDAQLHGELLAVVDALRSEPDAIVLYPQPRIPLDTSGAAERLSEQPTRVLAHLWHGLVEEMLHYQHGESAWNSRLRVGPGKHKQSDWVLSITRPRTFRVADDTHLPPRLVLDGTADVELLRRLLLLGEGSHGSLDTVVVRVPEDLPPPPAMRHIAVRLQTRRGGVKRYNKTSFTWEHDARARERALAEVQYLLQQLDPDGALRAAERVGLITFEGIEAEMRAALRIPERVSGHFWGVRGSNRFADCTVLLVVGRPRLPAEQVVRMAQVLCADDEHALNSETFTAADGTHHFRDPRLEQLDTYLTRAELTQAAHRNRPLIFDQRTVVTFCDEPIAYLPITTEVEHLPAHLVREHDDGVLGDESDDVKLERAAALLQERQVKQTVKALQAALKERYGRGLRAEVVRRWHKAHPPQPPHPRRFPDAA